MVSSRPSASSVIPSAAKPASRTAPVSAVSRSLASAPLALSWARRWLGLAARLMAGVLSSVQDAAALVTLSLFEPQGQHRAGPDRAAGGCGQPGRHGPGDHRKAPLVQLDELGEQVGTQAVARAG